MTNSSENTKSLESWIWDAATETYRPIVGIVQKSDAIEGVMDKALNKFWRDLAYE